MVTLAAFVLFPLVCVLLATGVGLLAERLLRCELPAGLLAPAGACVAVVVCLPVYRLQLSAAVAAPLLALLALAGYALARAQLRERLRPGWGTAAALGAFAMVMAPVALSGEWSWSGYNFVNDTATNMLMVDHVAHHGIQPAEGPASTATALINGTLGSRYPMGIHGLLATAHGILWFLPLEAVYQPFIAVLAGLAAMALRVLAGRAGLPGPAAAALGIVSVGGALTYGYALHGSFKEVALVLVLATGAALARVALDSRLHAGVIALLGGVLAAGVVIYSSAAGPYVAVLAVVLLAAALLGPGRPRPAVLARAAAAGAAALLVAVLPGLGDALAFGKGAEGYFTETGASIQGNTPALLGHLLRPLPLREASGIWIAGDYRVDLVGLRASATTVLTVLAVALALTAVVVELVRRRVAALLVLVPGLLVYLVAAPRLAPYAEAKLLVLLTPAVVFSAGIGAWWLARRVPVAGALAALGLAAGVVASDALAYHDTRLAPTDRIEALEDAFDAAPARGQVLVVEWEEFAKYLGRGREVNVGPETFSPRYLEMRVPGPTFARSFDLDEVTLPYVASFPSVVVRRGPQTSRPPLGFTMTYANRYYELWRRTGREQVVDHLPLLGAAAEPRAAGPARCQDVRDLAARARKAGDELVAARPAEVATFDYTEEPPVGWNRGGAPETVVPATPGTARGQVEVEGGRYRVWLRGGSGRTLRVSVDGRELDARGINTPGSWLPLGELELAPGAHRVELVRPGGSVAPGDGAVGELGPVALQAAEPGQLVTVPPAQAEARLCGRPWDWIEQVRR